MKKKTVTPNTGYGTSTDGGVVEFSKAQFEGLMADISTGLDDFSGRLEQIGPAAADAADRWFLPDGVADSIRWLGQETVRIGKEVLEFLWDLCLGVFAPICMYNDAMMWGDVRGVASNVSAHLASHQLLVDNSDWSGKARDAYVEGAAAHSEAAGQVDRIAWAVTLRLGFCASAGAVFYVQLAATLVSLILAAKAAFLAFASAVFSWAGAALVIEQAGFTTASVTLGLTGLATFLGFQAEAMVNLHGEAENKTAFPDGNWPSTNTSTFSDATVKDGDADWSLAPS